MACFVTIDDDINLIPNPPNQEMIMIVSKCIVFKGNRSPS